MYVDFLIKYQVSGLENVIVILIRLSFSYSYCNVLLRKSYLSLSFLQRSFLILNLHGLEHSWGGTREES